MAGKEASTIPNLSQWYRELAGTEERLQRNREPLEQVLALADLAFYSPTPIEIGPSSTIKTDVFTACSKLLKTWTSRRMKKSICDLPFNRLKGKNLTMTEDPITRETNSETTITPICEHQDAIDRLRARLNASLLGKEDVVEMVLVCLLSRGHILFDDLLGLGKTTLAKAVAIT